MTSCKKKPTQQPKVVAITGNVGKTTARVTTYKILTHLVLSLMEKFENLVGIRLNFAWPCETFIFHSYGNEPSLVPHFDVTLHRFRSKED